MTDRTTVTWTITDADGNPLANRMVYATLVAGVGGGSVDSLVVAERATARTDADGIATFSLWPNEAIDPDGTYYAFTADFARPPIVRYVEVPTSASPVEVADLGRGGAGDGRRVRARPVVWWRVRRAAPPC
ncbi:MAG: hypothetical protein H6983_26310 [Ectothiorhodospiraceae bacterium]|nr:hypothetical protein [Ectothiorhodospiraceae bacterium]